MGGARRGPQREAGLGARRPPLPPAAAAVDGVEGVVEPDEGRTRAGDTGDTSYTGAVREQAADSSWFGQYAGGLTGGVGGAGSAAGAAAGRPSAAAGPAGGLSTIDSYYLSRHCAVCDALTRVDQPLCEKCLGEPQMAVGVLGSRTARLERQHQQLVRLCLHCGGGGGGDPLGGGVVCESLDCGVFYERKKSWRELGAMSALAAAAGRALESEALEEGGCRQMRSW